MAAGPRVTVVVPTRDRPDALTRCLAALERQTVDDFEVVVVDDRSRHRDDVPRGGGARTARAAGRGGGAGSGGGAQPRGERRRRRDRVLHRRRLPAGRGLARRARAAVRRRRRGRGRTDPPRRRRRRAAPSQLVTNHLVDESRDASGAIGFAPTSNLACRRAVHRVGTVRRGVPHRGRRGPRVVRPPRRGRAPDRVRRRRLGAPRTGLDPARFWRQQARYGAGAYRYLSARPSGSRRQSVGFYVHLFRRAFADGLATGALVVMAQVATAAGLVGEAYRARGRALKQGLAAPRRR